MDMTKTKARADVEAANEILAVLSKTVLEVGEILEKVFVERPSFDDWVLTNLPLHPRTAERIRAMYLVWAEMPHGNESLPEPWKALWQLG